MMFRFRYFRLFLAALSLLFFSAAGCSDCADSAFVNVALTPDPSPAPTKPDVLRQIVTVHVSYTDGVPIGSVRISSENPLVHLIGAVTDEAGNYTFDIDAPDGTYVPLVFYKENHIIGSVAMTVGENGVPLDGHTILYRLFAVGYIPLDSDKIEGRVDDFFRENVALLNSPIDAVPSADGTRLYISDTGNGRIRVFDLETAELSTLVGSPVSGYQEGIGANVRFRTLAGLAAASDGRTLYVCDAGNHCIRRVDTRTGETSLFAGVPGVSGLTNGPAASARFSNPFKLAFSSDESFLYVADTYNGIVRRIDMRTLEVVSLGTAVNSTVYGIAVSNRSGEDVLYISSFNTTIYSVNVTTGARQTVAGGVKGNQDGVGTAARFALPTGLTASADGDYLYICDYSNNSIRKMRLSDNDVTTLSGSLPGYENGPADEARFLNPYYLSLGRDDTVVFVTDYKNNRIRAVDAESGLTDKIVGGGRSGFQDGPDGESTVSFSNTYGVALTSDSSALYLSDVVSIWKVDLQNKTSSVVAPSCYTGSAITNDTAYDRPNRGVSQKIVLSADEKTLYVADATCNMIRSIDIASGTTEIVAGDPAQTAGFADGTGTDVRFSQPNSLTLTPDGRELYVTDSRNHRIRKVTVATGETVTVAGLTQGFADGAGADARFSLPCGIVISPDGRLLYVTDAFNRRIRRIVVSGYRVDTLAGSSQPGFQDGIGASALFEEPRGIAISSDGQFLFVTDYGGVNIRRIRISDGSVISMAGGIYVGYADGTGAHAMFRGPDGIAVNREGSMLYVADLANSMLRVIVATDVTTYTEERRRSRLVPLADEENPENI